MLSIKFSKFFALLLALLASSIKSDSDDNYYFALYPSIDTSNPNYIYVITNGKFWTINATEGENFKIISQTLSGESTYKNISSLIIINDTYLVKSCFLNNKLVQIIKNGNTYYSIKNLNNIKFCYSTEILNPKIDPTHKEKYVIITYYTEILYDGTYSHKAIIFYPFTNTFSDELTLKSDSSFIINDYYPENCITLRKTDIYCSIHFTGHSLVNFNIIGNNYVLETSKLFLSQENIHLVLSNSITSTSNKFKKLIPLNRQETSSVLNVKTVVKDIYLTECHQNEDSIKTWLKFSYYIEAAHLSYIEDDNGLKISDKTINPNLLNYLVPNQDEMLIIYINKDTKTNLFISRINTKNIDANYMGYAVNNYFRSDICSQPVYMKSTYIKSFINYNSNDKLYMKNNPGKSFYKYEEDMGLIISCKDVSSKYQTIKVELPQCLNELDDINGNNFHNLRLTDDKNEIIFDIYNDPNLKSFRDSNIYFHSSQIFVLLITMKIKQEGDTDYKAIQFDKEYKSITHIKFIKNKYFSVSSSFKLQYTVQKIGLTTSNGVNAMKSNVCFLEFNLDNINQQTCSIDYCTVCETASKCKICDPYMEGITLDVNTYSTNYGKCICDENKGFQKNPTSYQMCICKNGYSFYNGKSLCKNNYELENGPYYIDDIEENSNIPIYRDCPIGCEKCTKNENLEVICTKCFNGFVLKNQQCDNGDCDVGEWFKLGKYIFKYIKIENCVFIFEGKDLFLISDKDSCTPYMKSSKYEYIKGCLHNDINITKFTDLENVNIYNPYSTDIIASKYSEDNKIYFHLMKYNSINTANISSLKIIKNKRLLTDEDFLIFKADIKREDTISRQVEYQLYNVNKYKINEKIILNDYNGNNLKVILSLPISWRIGQEEKVNELPDINIAFNSSSSFYLDVCEKFTNKENDDVFLEDRKEQYYINEPICESGCEFLKYDKDTNNVYCHCNFKENTDNYNKVTFSYNKVDEKFNKRIIGPNFVTMKCGSVVSKSLKNNFGFFATFFLLIAFAAFFCVYLINFYVIKKPDKLNEELKKISDHFESGNINESAQDRTGSSKNKDKNNENNEVNIHNIGPKYPTFSEKGDLVNDVDNQSQNTNNKIVGGNNNNQEEVHNSFIENEIPNPYPDLDEISNENNSNHSNENNNNKNSGNENNSDNYNKNNVNEININNMNENNNDVNKNNNNNENNGNENNSNNYNKNKGNEININNMNEDINNKGDNSNNINTDNNINNSNNNNNINAGKNTNNGTEENDPSNNFAKRSLPEEPPKGNNDNNLIPINKEKNEKDFGKKDLISEGGESNDLPNINIQNEKESILDTDKITQSERPIIPNYTFEEEDKKEESDIVSSIQKEKEDQKEGEDQKEEKKEVNIDEINLEDNENKEEASGAKNNIIFGESTIAYINNPFFIKDDKVNNISSKEDKKKNHSQKYNPANPPGKDDKGSTTESQNSLIGPKKNLKENVEEIINDDSYFLDKRDFSNMKEKGKEDKRNVWHLLLSVIKNNSTIYLVFMRKHHEDLFIMASLIILFISLYLCLNTFLLYNISMVKLYTGCISFGNFVLNIFLTSFFISIIIIVIKKFMTNKDYIYSRVINCDEYIKNKENKKKNKSKRKDIKNSKKSENHSTVSSDSDRSHNLSDTNNNFRRSMEKKKLIYGLIGILFLIFNCILVTSFCGIYSNSVGGLVLNTFLSIIFSTLIRILYFLIGVILRFYSLKKNSETMYNISRLFNPLNLSWEELTKLSFPGIQNICNKKMPNNIGKEASED